MMLGTTNIKKTLQGLLSDWLNDWLTDWLNDWPTGLFNDWPTDWLTGWLNEWPTDWLNEWMTGSLTDWLNDWLTDWQAEWRTDWRCVNRVIFTMALSKGSATLGVFLSWRQKQCWLPKRSASLKITRWIKSVGGAGGDVRQPCGISSSEPYRVGRNSLSNTFVVGMPQSAVINTLIVVLLDRNDTKLSTFDAAFLASCVTVDWTSLLLVALCCFCCCCCWWWWCSSYGWQQCRPSSPPDLNICHCSSPRSAPSANIPFQHIIWKCFLKSYMPRISHTAWVSRPSLVCHSQGAYKKKKFRYCPLLKRIQLAFRARVESLKIRGDGRAKRKPVDSVKDMSLSLHGLSTGHPLFVVSLTFRHRASCI